LSAFADRTVLVTGAASGIGLATARRFVREGARLALCDLRGDELRARADELGAPPDAIFCAAVDMRAKNEIGKFVASAVETFGRIDALVNNVGGGRRGRVQDLADEDWRAVMDLSLDSVFHASRAAMPHLIATRGNIVNIPRSRDWPATAATSPTTPPRAPS